MFIKQLTFLLGATLMVSACKGPAKIQVSQVNGSYKFLKNGKVYTVKGAGCEFGNFELLARNGANTLRTWRVDNGKETGEQILDKARKNGLMVCMGIEIARERHGFNYNDTAMVSKQKEEVRKQVLRLRNHPNLFAWGIGNELNLNASNPKVWNAINDIARMIHQLDPNHPVTTMLAGLGRETVAQVKERCPDLDFVSVQMYGDLINLQTRIRESGMDRPYVVSEWGATGHWEVAKTEWDAPIEQTSSEKAASILERYTKAIHADSMRCLGNFVFVWEQKQERTPTWYGLFSENGEQTEAIDILYSLWNGHWPANRCPSVANALLNGKKATDNCYVKAGEKMKASIQATDPDHDVLQYSWEIMPESTDLANGGDHESRPHTLDKLTTATSEAELNAPVKPGAYRLFIYVLDGKNHAGTANIPFFVK